MTDARFPDRWLTDRRFILLSGDGYKLYGTALTWCVDNRSDGFLDERDLPCLPGVALGCIGELEEARLFIRRAGGWSLPDFKKTQTSRKELERADAKREDDRLRKARERDAKKAEAASGPSSEPDPPDVPADVHEDVHVEVPRDAAVGRPSGRSRRGDARPREATPGAKTRKEQEEQTRAHAREKTCLHCGQSSSFSLSGGYCSRGPCVDARRAA